MRSIQSLKRSCGGCTKCCEGWLVAEIYGHKIGEGAACKFLTKNGCGIYSIRPYDPCAAWTCFWKDDISLPEWMRPNLSNVILVKSQLDEYKYFNAIATKPTLADNVIEFLKEMSKGKYKKNIVLIYNRLEYVVFSENDEFKKQLVNEQSKKTNN